MDDFLTLTEMTTILANDRAELEATGHALTTAANTYRTKTQRALFETEDGYQGALTEHLRPLTEAERKAAGVGTAAEMNARKVLAATTHNRIVLPNEIEESVAYRLPVVRQLVETADWLTLRDEFRAAVIADDKPTLFAFSTVLGARLDKDDPSIAARPDVMAARNEIRTLHGRVRDSFRDTSFDAIRKQATDALERAHSLKAAAAKRQRDRQTQDAVKRGDLVPWPKAS